jgi:glucose-1-phosphate adenylyltransferase
MREKECIAMLLAGGQGSRLGSLTKTNAKPAVIFGGKYRIIDFSLSNCVNSGIDTVGILTQYKPLSLNRYIGTGEAWDLDISSGGVSLLSPYYTETGGEWYKGTADAIYRHIDFIGSYNPEHVIILSGDHLYKMDYSEMLSLHKKNNADLTISVIEVPWKEAGRYGVLSVDDNMNITDFKEKPALPESNLASMGIYIFKWDALKKVLLEDHEDEKSDKDFGKNIIPRMLRQMKRVQAYRFNGYWMDVGTIDSYYRAHMDLLEENPNINIFEKEMRIFSNSNIYPPHYIGEKGKVSRSLVCNGCSIFGEVRNSILSYDVVVGENALVDESILLPGARVEKGARVFKAIIGEGAVVKENYCFCGGDAAGKIAVLGDNELYYNENEVLACV